MKPTPGSHHKKTKDNGTFYESEMAIWGSNERHTETGSGQDN